jgi:cell division protein ZapA
VNEADKSVSRVTVRILEKDYVIACPPEERAALLESVEVLNGKMREVRDSGKVVGLDRIAVIAALNLTNDMLRLRTRDRRVDSEFSGRVRALRERADAALARNQQLDL